MVGNPAVTYATRAARFSCFALAKVALICSMVGGGGGEGGEIVCLGGEREDGVEEEREGDSERLYQGRVTQGRDHCSQGMEEWKGGRWGL
jgi:hypothetical protein